MLRDLTIKNYRAFKDFSIDGLARVNLIVGSNNAGKTSFLEAVYLLLGKDNRFALPQLLQARREYSETKTTPDTVEYKFPIAHLFNGHKPVAQSKQSTNAPITIHSSHDRDMSFEISFKTADLQASLLNDFNRSGIESTTFGQSFMQFMTLQNQLYPYELQLNYGANTIAYPVDYNSFFRFNAFRDDAKNSLSYLTPRNDDTLTIAQLWENVAISLGKEDAIIRGLQILDKDVRDIRLSSIANESNFLIGRLNEAERIPLTSMGDGMRRILTLSTAAITTEEGALFIDEIDTGLHYRAQADVWRLLLAIAKERDIQIFATTHSWDCVAAFQEALIESDSPSIGQLIRLEKTDRGIRKVPYTASDLAIAVREGIEVR